MSKEARRPNDKDRSFVIETFVLSHSLDIEISSFVIPADAALTTSLRHKASTACRHVVSGSFDSPGRGSFHLSIALLGSLSVTREYLALGDGPPGFSPGSTCRDLLGDTAGVRAAVEYGAVTRSGRAFQRVLLADGFVTPCGGPHDPARP